VTQGLNPGLTFDTLIVGASNRLAVTAARAVAENPGEAYNPLFISGRTGLGKTHVITAIGNRANELQPSSVVEYVTLDELLQRYHASVSSGELAEFRSQLSASDVLLIDDIQFLVHRKELQSELLRVVTQFQREGRQLVLTGDCPPADLSELDEQLLNCLNQGVAVEIGVPEFETRQAILERRTGERGSEFADGVLEAVAEYEVRNVRELLGILNRVIAFQEVSDTRLTPAAARALVTGDAPAAGAAGAEATVPLEPAEAAEDEFGDFLSDITLTVTQQVEAWNERIGKMVQVWSERGYTTTRLERLLEEQAGTDPAAAVAEFQNAVTQLQRLEREMAELDPVAARNPVFRDPDRLEEAVGIVTQMKSGLEPPPGPDEAFSLETFLAGESTKMAVGAAQAVIQEPGARYNPLVLVGPSGVGKTHLLHAVGRGLQIEGELVVACLSAQTFIEELVEAIEKDRVGVWRARYRCASAFMLDDVHEISSRDRVQQELLELIQLFCEEGRQLVVTSNVAPQEIEGLGEDLAGRLAAGLVASLGSPDRELRRAIVLMHLTHRVGSSDEALADYLAQQSAESVRTVLGTLERVLSGAEAVGTAPSVDVAKRLLERPVATEAPVFSGRETGTPVPLSGVNSREKMVWDWIDPEERLVEDAT
jgi:chromosomal replication initiation ATPase DnaA